MNLAGETYSKELAVRVLKAVRSRLCAVAALYQLLSSRGPLARNPHWALAARIRWADRVIAPRGSTIIEPRDVVGILTTTPRAEELRVWIDRSAKGG